MNKDLLKQPTESDMFLDDFDLKVDIKGEKSHPVSPEELVLKPNSFPERDIVVAEQAKRKKENKTVSPNSKIMKAYRAALPPLSEHLHKVLIGLMLGDISIVPNTDKTAYSIKFEWGDVNKAYAFHI